MCPCWLFGSCVQAARGVLHFLQSRSLACSLREGHGASAVARVLADAKSSTQLQPHPRAVASARVACGAVSVSLFSLNFLIC